MKAQIAKIEDHQAIFVYAALALCAAIFAFYGYFLNSAIRNVIARQNVESQAVALRASQSSLESNYVALKDSITLNSAKALGFADANDTLFINAEGPSKTALSYNDR